MRALILAALLLLSATASLTAQAAPSIRERLRAGACEIDLTDPKMPGSWRPLREAMNYALTHPDELLAELLAAGPAIQNVHHLADTQEGGGYTFTVDTDRGLCVAKGWTSGRWQEHLVSVIIQMAMAELGLAPAVQGLLLPDRDGDTRFNARRSDRIPPLVLIMDFVPNARVLHGLWLDNDWGYSPALNARIRTAIAHGERAMAQLLISPYDEQMLASESAGIALFIDFDGFTVLSDYRLYSSVEPSGQNAVELIRAPHIRNGVYAIEAALAFLGLGKVRHR